VPYRPTPALSLSLSGITEPTPGSTRGPKFELLSALCVVTAVPVALYFTVGAKYAIDTSSRRSRKLSPAGFVSTVAPSRGAATPAPPIESCTGPKPMSRIPFVAHAGVAASIPTATALLTTLLM
jgi:hypothetical protein